MAKPCKHCGHASKNHPDGRCRVKGCKVDYGPPIGVTRCQTYEAKLPDPAQDIVRYREKPSKEATPLAAAAAGFLSTILQGLEVAAVVHSTASAFRNINATYGKMGKPPNDDKQVIESCTDCGLPIVVPKGTSVTDSHERYMYAIRHRFGKPLCASCFEKWSNER